MWNSLLNDMEVPETKRDTPLRDTAPLNTSSGLGFHVLRFDKPRPNYASSFDWTDGSHGHLATKFATFEKRRKLDRVNFRKDF